jgi:hypothetical protein
MPRSSEWSLPLGFSDHNTAYSTVNLHAVKKNSILSAMCEVRDLSKIIGVMGLDDRGTRIRFLAGAGNFLFTTAFRTALGPTQPPIQWIRETLSLRVKRPGRETDHSPPSSAEVKHAWIYTSTPPIRLHGTGRTLPFTLWDYHILWNVGLAHQSLETFTYLPVVSEQ